MRISHACRFLFEFFTSDESYSGQHSLSFGYILASYTYFTPNHISIHNEVNKWWTCSMALKQLWKESHHNKILIRHDEHHEAKVLTLLISCSIVHTNQLINTTGESGRWVKIEISRELKVNFEVRELHHPLSTGPRCFANGNKCHRNPQQSELQWKQNWRFIHSRSLHLFNFNIINQIFASKVVVSRRELLLVSLCCCGFPFVASLTVCCCRCLI